MITALNLENWKSHSSSSFTFGRGTNILVGRMGSGKSSVLDALCFALYGTFPKMSRRDQTTEHLVNIASGAEAARVELEFEKGGKKYKVIRRIGKKISEAEVQENGKLVQKGPKPVTEFVTSALGVDYELFTRAIYSEQNRIDYLLSLNPRARKQEIDWLLGLGQFDTAREGAQEAHYKLSEAAQLLSGETDERRLSELSEKIGEQKKQAETRKERLAYLLKSAEQTFSKKNELETSLASLEKSRAEWKRESSECERQSGALARLRKETEGRKKPGAGETEALCQARKKLEQEALEAKQSSKKTRIELSAAERELAVLENSAKLALSRAKRKAELEAKLKALEGGKSLKQLEGQSSELKREIETLTNEHAAFHAEMKDISAAVHALNSSAAKCPVCDSDLSHGKAGKIADVKKSEMEKKKGLAEKHSRLLQEKKSTLLQLEKNLLEIKNLTYENERLAGEGAGDSHLDEKILEKAGRKKSLEAEADAWEKKLSALDILLQQSRKAEDEMARTAQLFSELETASALLEAAQKKLSALSFSEERYENVRKAAEALRLDYAKAEAEASSEEKQLALVEELSLSLQKEISAIEEKKHVALKYAEAAASMAIYKNSLVAAQSELRSTLVEEINDALCEIWPAVYPYSDYSGVKMEADEKDYRLLMQKDGWREVDSVASGGERACLCLALRIAFATVLTPDIGWLILDEPTHNLDAEAVQLLSEAINTKIPSIVAQTFVITHDTALGESGEGCVFRLERDKAKNESTRIESL